MCFSVKGLILSTLLLLPWLTIANENGDNTSWGLGLSFSANYQNYDEADAQQYSLRFKPYYVLNNWDFQLIVPFVAIDGNYFDNGAFPRYQNICNRLLGLSKRAQQYLVDRERISQQQLDNCQTNLEAFQIEPEVVSGISDITLIATYGWYVGLASRAFIAGTIVMDSGDYSEGLGSGARQFYVASGVATVWSKWITQITLGYSFVDATDALEELNNYGFLSAGAEYDLKKAWQLGLQFRWEQPYFIDADNINTVSLSSGWDITQKLRLNIDATSYLNGDDYPSAEIGAALNYHF